MLELREERPPEQELLEQAQEQGEGPCGPIRGGREGSFHGECIGPIWRPRRPNSDSKSTEVTDNVTASVRIVGEGSIDPEEELQLGMTKGIGSRANSAEGGAGVCLDR